MGRTFQALLTANRRIKVLELEVEELKTQLEPPVSPIERGTISNTDVFNLYAKIFPEGLDKIFLSDTQYEITSISEIRRFVNWDNVNIFPYISEIHDCDDFALALAGDFAKYPEWSGFPVTFLWSSLEGGHAYSTCIAWKSFVDRTPTVFFIEPQNDHELVAEMMESIHLWLLPV